MFGAGLLFSLCLAGFAYEYWACTAAEQRYPPPGELIQVKEHKLHMVKKGRDGPTVVFEAGLGGEGHMSWSLVQDRLAEDSTTVSYDCAGYLWSERGSGPKTCEAMAEELYQMLDAAGVSKPYILVGHSMAGFILRSFVSQYHEDVAGVVLVDVSHPEQDLRFPPEMLANPHPNWLELLSLKFGLKRLRQQFFVQSEPVKDPTLALMEARTKQLLHKWLPTCIEEGDRFAALADEAAEINTFGDIPLVVLTGTKPARRDYLKDTAVKQTVDGLWLEMQQELLLLSSNSRHLLVPQAGHVIQVDHPQAVIDAVLGLLNTQKSRNSSPEGV